MLVVFSSNIEPEDLVDASFLRRIQTKIKLGAVTGEQFSEIFRRVAAEMQVPYDPRIPNELIDFIEQNLGQELRSCYPRDIVNQVVWAARYENKKPYLDVAALAQAIDAYFPKKANRPAAEQPLVFASLEQRAAQRFGTRAAGLARA